MKHRYLKFNRHESLEHECLKEMNPVSDGKYYPYVVQNFTESPRSCFQREHQDNGKITAGRKKTLFRCSSLYKPWHVFSFYAVQDVLNKRMALTIIPLRTKYHAAFPLPQCQAHCANFHNKTTQRISKTRISWAH